MVVSKSGNRQENSQKSASDWSTFSDFQKKTFPKKSLAFFKAKHLSASTKTFMRIYNFFYDALSLIDFDYSTKFMFLLFEFDFFVF